MQKEAEYVRWFRDTLAGVGARAHLHELLDEVDKSNGRHSGICGQAPSNYPEIAEALARMGIDSISLNPDTVPRTTRRVLSVEKKLDRAPRES